MKRLVLFIIAAFCFASADAQRWYSYDEYLNNSLGVGNVGYNLFYLWNDTTGIFGYGGTTPTYGGNNFVSVGLSFAPVLATWNDTSLYRVKIKVGPTDAYYIDSVKLYGVYERNNARTSPVDTVFMSFVYGNGFSTTTNLEHASLTGLLGTYGYDPLSYLQMGYDSINNRAGRFVGAIATPYAVYLPLYSTDTSSNFNRAIALPTPYLVPAGNVAGMSFTFHSGDATYTPGDTVVYTSGAYKYGSFNPYIEYNYPGGFVDFAHYDLLDSNYGYFKQISPAASALGWSSSYIPTWAWNSGPGVASILQYPVFDFHVNCPTCMLNDTIMGNMHVCVGGSTTLTFPVPFNTGTWSAGSGVTISSSGVVTGTAAGVTHITYTLGTNKAISTFTVDVVPSPITGVFTACAGGGTTTLSDLTAGGTWSASPSSVATISSLGTASGIAAGTATVTYTSSAGCVVLHGLTVNPTPPAIMGTTSVCTGLTTTLSDAASGGTWSSSSTGIATVSGSGVVSGVSAGTSAISYTVGGCSASTTVTVLTTPSAGTITGPSTVCVGSSISLIDPASGGTWTSGTTSIATVTSGGSVTGVATGSSGITYTVTNACGTNTATATVSVNPLPNAGAIVGPDTVCVGHGIILSDLASGGVWTSSNTSVATVTSAGTVSGVAGGVVNISYSVTNSCGTDNKTQAVLVIPTVICQLGTTTVTMSENPQMKVFPNPNDGSFAVNIVSAKNEVANVVITNVAGEKVMEFSVNTNKAKTVTLNQPAGVYIITATSSDGVYVSKLLVK